MIDNKEITGQVVQAYYDVLGAATGSFDEARLRACLASDLVFEGPIAGRVVGADRFARGVAGFADTVRGISILQLLSDGDAAAALYDAELPGGTVRIAEFFRVEGGRIRSVRLLYDATEYRARGRR